MQISTIAVITGLFATFTPALAAPNAALKVPTAEDHLADIYAEHERAEGMVRRNDPGTPGGLHAACVTSADCAQTNTGAALCCKASFPSGPPSCLLKGAGALCL